MPTQPAGVTLDKYLHLRAWEELDEDDAPEPMRRKPTRISRRALARIMQERPTDELGSRV